MLLFEWDPQKAESNFKKHSITFDEASSVFKDTLSLTIDDPLYSRNNEERSVLIGISHKNRFLTVVHTERNEKIRIISARKSTKSERRFHESNG
ncbi:MAG: BrnT family toxin [Aquificales bacterium]|nr:BrnT family toxin [Aquificales bacterium]